MAGYTRNDTGNNIADGNVINASDLDGEFDAVEAAFNNSTGHTHDGTSAEGAPIEVAGPAQDLVITATEVRPKTDNTLDLGTNTLEFKDLYLDGTANIDSLVADTADINAGSIDGVTLGTNSAVTSAVITTADINSGTIDGTTIGGSTPAAGSFTTGQFDTSLNVDGTVTADGLTVESAENNLVTISSTDAFANLRFKDNLGSNRIVTSNGAMQLQSGGDTSFTGLANRINIGANGDISFYEDTGTTPKLVWDASAESLGIGTSSPSTLLHVSGSSGVSAGGSTPIALRIDATDQDFGAGTWNTSADFTQLQFYSADSSGAGAGVRYSIGAVMENNNGSFSSLTFRSAGGTERMRIDSSGNLLVGTTSTNLTATGQVLFASGSTQIKRDGATPFFVNRLTNDGTLVQFYGQSVAEGSISISGSTVSYNGGHLARWSQLADNTRDESIVKGTVMSNLDQMAEWTHEGVTEDNEQLNCMKVSDVEGDADVAGVFVNWDNDDDIYTNDMNIAMTGDMVIRIAQGTTVQRGDLLMSAGDGTAKPQGDDIVRSKTIAKVTSTHVSHTYDDGSYLVPCVLMAC